MKETARKILKGFIKEGTAGISASTKTLYIPKCTQELSQDIFWTSELEEEKDREPTSLSWKRMWSHQSLIFSKANTMARAPMGPGKYLAIGNIPIRAGFLFRVSFPELENGEAVPEIGLINIKTPAKCSVSELEDN